MGKKLVREGVGGSFVCATTGFAFFSLGFLGLAPGFHSRETLGCGDITRESEKVCLTCYLEYFDVSAARLHISFVSAKYVAGKMSVDDVCARMRRLSLPSLHLRLSDLVLTVSCNVGVPML